ncbi:peptidase inhibitor family I36 protein [Nonomuraea sp. NPDC049309]|uniref:peptidase inhibitor family I36 protein n=1 Tax=Nonomuraea sp. NPDC049309 TaxID=3364350 RepID=UPI00371E20BB
MRRITTIATRLLAGLAVAAAVTAATPSAQAAPRVALPEGVFRLANGQPCPWATLCLYRDYNRSGPAYGVRAGFDVDLFDLPMPGGVGGSSTAANNISSWVNRTGSTAVLVDLRRIRIRLLLPGRSLEEPPGDNDTVDFLRWR